MLRFRRLILLLAFAAAAAVTLSAQTSIPTSGQPVPSLAQLDTIMKQYMTQYHSPGANLSVSVDGRLIFARGYGYANTTTGELVQPDSRMRLASNSKPFTAAAIYKLVEQGKLSLTTKPFASILTDLTPPSGKTEDPRILNITIQNLLEHKAGYDDGAGYPFDPVNDYTTNRAAAAAAGLTGQACTPKALISYELGVQLQHDPGTTYAYSNLGYLTLGYIIERVTGVPYATWLEQNIFPLANMMQTLPAGNLASDKLPYEVAYYGYPGEPTGPSMVPPTGTQVPYEYGGYDLVLELANGGWTSTPMDLLRFNDSLNGQFATNILANPPSGFTGEIPPVGQGWGYNFYGSLPGTNSLVHLDTSSAVVGRVVYSAIFNTRDGSNLEQPESDADNAIYAFVKTVKAWPAGDLFPTYATSGTACSFTLASASATATANGPTGSVGVTDANYCGYSAVSNAAWIHVTSGALYSDSATVAYSVDVNSGPYRTGTITIGGQTFTINQSGVAASTNLSVSGSKVYNGTSSTLMLTATLSPYSATGVSTDGEVITFSFAAQGSGAPQTIGTATLKNGVASLTMTSAGDSGTSVFASYPGDNSFSASTSGTTVVSSVAASISPSSLTFPSTPVSTTSAAQIVTLTNTGSANLSINSVIVTAGFTQSSTCSGVISAGANCTFSVTYKPTATGNTTGTLDISDNAGDQIVNLSGTAVAAAPVVTLSANSLTFPSTTVNTSAPVQTVTVTNTGNAPLTISNIAAISGNNQFTQTNNCTTASIAVNAYCTVSITFSPTTTGTLTANVILTDNASPSSQSISLTGTGSSAPAPIATFSPTSLTFPSTQVGTTSASMSTTLTNTGTATLTVGAASAAGDFSLVGTTCGSSVAVNGSCVYTATFTPTATGTRTGSLNFTTNASSQVFALAGSGAAYPVPVVSLMASPTSLTYGQPVTLSASASNVPSGANYTFSLLEGATVLATATTPGSSFSYIVPTPTGGTHSYTAVFTSSNTATYPTATSTAATVTVAKAATTSTFAMPAAITYGTALSATQLAASSSTAGSFTYTPSAGAILTAGTQNLSATLNPTDATDYAGSNAGTTIVVNKAPLTITAANANRVYGAANPAFTGTVSGLVNADAITASYTSSATATTAAGTTVSITPTPADPNNRLANYNVMLVNGTLTIAKANTNATLTVPASTPAGSSITLTANIASATSGSPTGTVTVTAGSTTVGSAALVNGVVTFTYTPPTGSTTLTLTYPGDSNFNASTGSLTVSTGLPDFSLTVAPPTASVTAGMSAVYTLTNSGINGFSQTIFYSCSGLPANSACAFAPAIVATGQSSQLTITTRAGLSAFNGSHTPEDKMAVNVAGTMLALLFGLPLLRRRSSALRRAMLSFLLLAGLTASLAGCGSSDVSSASNLTPKGTYTVTINATTVGATTVHTSTLTLTVQ